jgi:nicotinate-nucleotide adenylyltransferase
MPSRRPLAVLGGTFDPPHIGHLVLGECVAAQFDCDVLFVPAGDPYRKTGTDTPENRRATIEPHAVTSGTTRLEMVELAIAGNPKFRADAREVRRAGPSYTVDTLRELHDEGHTELILVLGSDALADMPNWREPDEIQRLARIVIAEKESGASTGGFQRIDMPLLRVSSTEVRQRVSEGRPIRYLVPEAVERIIAERGLYRIG